MPKPNREKDKIKTLHEIGKMDYKEAKEAILQAPKPEIKIDIDYSQHMLDPRIFNELVVLARQVLQKNPDADPEQLLDKLEKERRVKDLLKADAINEGDLRDALSAASTE